MGRLTVILELIGRRFGIAAALLSLFLLPARAATNWVVVGWNNLGMHCMDNDFSVSCTLPPYNTILAQVIVSYSNETHLVTPSSGYGVSYQAVSDPDGSINRTSAGKGNFVEYALPLFGVLLPSDTGLPVPGPESFSMPGTSNLPQPMLYETNFGWYVAYGVPITPYDDQLRRNPYPLMRFTATNGTQQVAFADVVLPVSDEMDCRGCHTSGGETSAVPARGWVWDPDPKHDYRLNPLLLHDEKQATNALYGAALAARGFSPDGLYKSVIRNGKPILCAACHQSEALPGSGYPGIKPLTQAIHRRHATVKDPATGAVLGSSEDRTSCYRCHPGSVTRCLRGAMGKAVAANGALAMQCQDCHGGMTDMGATNRTGWLNEPDCQACHTGDALTNNGLIRYDNAFTNGALRVAVNRRFATNTNAPGPGLSLYRFSRGHGGLYCEACHGSTHAEFPTSFRNDNLYSIARQGHEGPLGECMACHQLSPSTVTNGPHGMHPVGQDWVTGHQNPAKGGRHVQCRTCHGVDYNGTVLSRSFANRTLATNSDIGQKPFWRGFTIGCYACHLGPEQSSVNYNRAPVAYAVSTNTAVNALVAIPLRATDPDGQPVTLRLVSQPAHGRVSLSGTNAVFFPDTAFSGTDTFTFAASDGSIDSNLATGRVVVAGVPFPYSLSLTNAVYNELSHAGVVQVNAGTGYPWVVSSEAVWIEVLSAVSGAGTGRIFYAVDGNPSASARTGTLSVAGLALSITQAGAPPDPGGDGIPDNWQVLHFGSAGSLQAAASADPDHDGADNLSEYQAGTVPTNSASVFKIVAIDRTGAVFEVAFPTVTNRLYHLRRTDSLTDGDWEAFTNAVLGTGQTFIIPDNAATNKVRFYRARLAF